MTEPQFTTTVHAVRATMIDGSQVDLLLFADPVEAATYVQRFRPLPLGFDRVDVVDRQIVGAIGRRS